MFGARSAMTSTTASPKASRCSSQVPSARWYGRVLHEAAHDVLARRRHARVDERGDDDVDVGPAAEAPGLGVVVGLLHVVERGREADGAPQVLAGARQRGEGGQAVERQVDLAGRAAEAEAPHLGLEVRLQRARPAAAPGTCAVRPCWRARRAPRSPRRSRARRPWHGRPGPLICATGASVRISAPRCAGGAGDGLGHAARAALGDAPGAEGAVDLAHVVVQQHVGRARRAHAQEGADDARGRHRGLERLRLEPALQEVGRAHRHELDEGRAAGVAAGPRSRATSAGQRRGCIPWVRPSRVAGRHAQDGLDEARHLRHQRPYSP